MTMMQDVYQSAGNGVALARKAEDFNLLTKPECAAAIWQWAPAPAFQTWINGLNPENLPSIRLILKPEAVLTTLSKLCDTLSIPDRPHRRRLIEDIGALSYLFCDLMCAPYMRLRLERITSNACHKFHMDAVTARLVCTYRGTGTQFGISHDGGEPEPIFTAPTGTPILLRGTLLPEEPRSGLLHRSPPIEGSGETRLVLVLDPIYELDEDT